MLQRYNMQSTSSFQNKPVTITLHYTAQKWQKQEDYKDKKSQMNGTDR